MLFICDDTFIVTLHTGQLHVGADGLDQCGLRCANVDRWHPPTVDPGPPLRGVGGNLGAQQTDRPAQALLC
jgi:hypothetical protein